jgi:isopentenyl-diphosphate Delta-isomerase
MNRQEVILVDENDRAIGRMEKIEAHKSGRLHRAFSVFIFNSRKQVLLHQRADEKYHSPGLWTNACCSHPLPGEETGEGARKRLQEEMGLVCDLEEAFAFTYRADVGKGLIEHEFDHVFFGYTDTDPVPAPGEVQDWKWLDTDEVMKQMHEHPARFTTWFHIAMPMVMDKIN